LRIAFWEERIRLLRISSQGKEMGGFWLRRILARTKGYWQRENFKGWEGL